ncbi:DUF4838 domain-containing protein [Ruminococcaceae bacterium OttesenSCG-928-D13]|nr:DUF4838 domain-containing protein [Ruminococcaceae bacterium OttesenSCG-928-D13]
MKLLIADQGAALYPVWTAPDAAVTTLHAANELVSFLSQMSGARFALLQGETPPAQGILVGDSRYLAADDELGKEGYVVRTVGRHICIAGGQPRGVLYGVYSFLETLGCRWFAADASHIPQRSRLEAGPLDLRQVPALEYRETWFNESEDANWSVRNKHTGNFTRLDATRGGKIVMDPFVHSFDMIVPVDRHFDSHPEYFSMVDGQRIRERTQLCLTNPDVLRLTVEWVLDWIEKNPQVSVVSVSQNDWYNPCECPACKALDDAEGSHAGSLIHFVNAVAEQVEQRYPDVVISTLAYQYTRRAPKKLRPRHNVCVMLCSIECCFAHPLRECNHIASFPQKTYGTTFQQDLQAWAAVCDRLYIWNYAVNYSHYLMPYPNFHVFADNLRYFIENNVKGVYEEGAPSWHGGTEFAAMRAWVLVRLMWDPTQDTTRLVAEFINGYYKGAAVPVLRYHRLLQDTLAQNPDIHFGIYDPARPTYLTAEVMAEARKLMDEALVLADDDTIWKRVRTLWASVRYWELYTLPVETPDRPKMLDDFFQELENLGITMITEGHTLRQTRKLMDMGEVWRQRRQEGIEPPPPPWKL